MVTIVVSKIINSERVKSCLGVQAFLKVLCCYVDLKA